MEGASGNEAKKCQRTDSLILRFRQNLWLEILSASADVCEVLAATPTSTTRHLFTFGGTNRVVVPIHSFNVLTLLANGQSDPPTFRSNPGYLVVHRQKTEATEEGTIPSSSTE